MTTREEQPPATASRPAGSNILETIESYLLLERQLTTADSIQRERLKRETEADYRREPTISSQMRYAIALAAPGASSEELETSRRLFHELLAAPEKLLLAETHIAQATLATIAHSELIQNEIATLKAAQEQTPANDRAALEQQLADYRERNAALRTELKDARSKLDAITSIEQSVERSENGDEVIP